MTAQTPDQKKSFKKKALIATTVAALAIGTVGIGALDTLRTSIEKNTSTVHGAHVTAPELKAAGDPFTLAYASDGTVTGDKETAWQISNSGDAPASWDGIFVASEQADPNVAAATKLTAHIPVTKEIFADTRWVTGNAVVDLDLGTLASPVSLHDAWTKWAQSGVMVHFATSAGTRSIPASEIPSFLSEDLAPGASVDLAVTPSFDSEKVGPVSASITEAESLVADGSFDVTYLKG